jgi:alkylhydroperoxidase/carboxymuconolactone decarboxylase family protein YurZ
MTASTGDLLALQCQGNAYALAKANERKRFNETAAMIRAAHNNGATQRQIATAVKMHRLTVARIVKGMDDKRRTLPVDFVETGEI